MSETRSQRLTVSYFSAGVSSAVATKLYGGKIDRIMHTDIDDHHPDNIRFLQECEEWFKQHIEVTRHRFLRSVDETCRYASFIRSRNGGAVCTSRLKRDVRKAFEKKHQGDLRIVWGFDYGERERADRIRQAMPHHEHVCPLIDERVTKQNAHAILKASGIQRPTMYELGYNNNNCIGCLKGGMGYWNHIRVDFPDVFRSRAILERDVGFPIVKKGVWLDELDPSRGRHNKPICDSCGIMCELDAID